MPKVKYERTQGNDKSSFKVTYTTENHRILDELNKQLEKAEEKFANSFKQLEDGFEIIDQFFKGFHSPKD